MELVASSQLLCKKHKKPMAVCVFSPRHFAWKKIKQLSNEN
jgi:hypothetical protein